MPRSVCFTLCRPSLNSSFAGAFSRSFASYSSSFFFFFFFQAEDGIRDPLVTGVQTCALPISPHPHPAQIHIRMRRRESLQGRLFVRQAIVPQIPIPIGVVPFVSLRASAAVDRKSVV